MRRPFRLDMIGPVIVGILTALSSVGATPLSASFSSCLGSYNAASDDARMTVTDVFANLVSGVEASRQGLIGEGHDVLRVDLVGSVGSTVIGYDNTTNKLGKWNLSCHQFVIIRC